MPLQTVAPQRLYQQIADQLRTLITAGEFTGGQVADTSMFTCESAWVSFRS